MFLLCPFLRYVIPRLAPSLSCCEQGCKKKKLDVQVSLGYVDSEFRGKHKQVVRQRLMELSLILVRLLPFDPHFGQSSYILTNNLQGSRFSTPPSPIPTSVCSPLFSWWPPLPLWLGSDGIWASVPAQTTSKDEHFPHAQWHCHFRLWELTVHFVRPLLAGRFGDFFFKILGS